jgi:DNA-binding transcriptional regulator/RsmH inhibitor MraZ
VADNVTLVGTGDHIVLWPTAEWEKHVEELLPTYGQQMLDAGDDAAPSGS